MHKGNFLATNSHVDMELSKRELYAKTNGSELMLPTLCELSHA